MTGARTRAGWSTRQLPSGKWQAVIRVDGARVSLGTHPTAQDAEHAAQAALVDQRRGRWHNPHTGSAPLVEWMESWLQRAEATGRHGPRTAIEAAAVVRLHIIPHLGPLPLRAVTLQVVRAWSDQLTAARRAAGKPVGTQPAKAYRLLHAALADAVRDGLIDRNPCDVPGAGVERSAERPLITPDQIADLVHAAPERRRALILLAGWCGLRFGELGALTRRDVDLLHRRVHVRQALADTGTGLVAKDPKSRAGLRTVAVPAELVADLEGHMARWVGPDPADAVFRGERGGLLRRSPFAREWARIRADAGLPKAVRFHDLRHAAGTMAAQAGATQAELQARLGHASPEAARRYQHAAASRDEALADRLGEMVGRAQRTVSARTTGIGGSRGA